MLCVMAGALHLLTLGEGDFSLAWSHSVTRDEWREEWHAGPAGLQLLAAEVKGPGAGLEIPENATRIKGGWRFTPSLGPLAELVLAASGETPSGWMLCQSGDCEEIGSAAGQAITLRWQDSACN